MVRITIAIMFLCTSTVCGGGTELDRPPTQVRRESDLDGSVPEHIEYYIPESPTWNWCAKHMEKNWKQSIFEVKKMIIDASYFIVSKSDFVSRNLIWV